MAMAQATLSAQLAAAMAPTLDESVAIANLMVAWTTYFSAALAGPIPYVPSPGATAAMAAALVDMSVANLGAVRLGAAIIVWWAALQSAPTTYFPTALVITPPPNLALLVTELETTFSQNRANSRNLVQSADAIATTIHARNIGGTATIPNPGVPPPTNVVVPIL